MKKLCALLLILTCMMSLFACPAPAPETGGTTTTTTTTAASGNGGTSPTAPLTLRAESGFAFVGDTITLIAGGTEGMSVSFTAPDGSVSTPETDGATYTATAAAAGVHTFTVTDGTRTASCAVTVYAVGETAYPVSDENIRILGRTEKNADGAILLNNTASGFEITFYGKSLSVDLCNAEGKIDTAIFALYIDDVGNPATDQIDLSLAGEAIGNTRRITLASFDTAGLHTVRLQKLTQEALAGAIFSAVYVEGGLLPTEPDEALRMMVFGDSITCGHSNMRGPGEDDTWSSARENGMLTYAMRVAAMLNADAHVFAKSGLGLYTDPWGATTLLKDIYGKVSPASGTDWDMTSWVPDAIIIGIGTNDICAPADAAVPYTKEAFIEAYMDFVRELASIWGDDKTFFLCSSMMLTAVGPAVQEAATRLMLEEGLSVYFVDLPLRSNLTVDGHPDNASHITGADVLYDAISKRMGMN